MNQLVAAALTSPSTGRGGSYRLDDHDVHGNHLVASTLKSQRGKDGGGIGPEETLVAETVRSHPRPGSNSNGDLVVAAPLSHGSNPNSNAAGRRREDDENLVTAFHQTQDPIIGDDFTPALGETSIGMGVGIGASVRRLTPTECERLQSLPDGFTDLGGTPDSRRYAALGDAVTASVSEWIGRRILATGR